MTRRIFTPEAHQVEMHEHILEHERCAIWAPMGSGKTVEVLNALYELELVEPGRSLALAPLRVASNVWPFEAQKWEHLKRMSVVPIVGTQAERIRALKLDVSCHTVNYDVLPWLIEYLKDNRRISWRWTRVVADESTRLKNFRLKGGGGERARAIGTVAHEKVRRWINLTGMPAPNGLKNLWGQTWFLDEGKRLGHSYSAFEQRWFAWTRKPNPTKHNHEIKQITLPFAQEQIHGLLSDICLTPTVAFSVEEVNTRPVYVELPKIARAQYNEMEKRMFAEINEHEVEAFTSAAKTMKCLQMASGTVWVDALQKLWTEVHDVKLQALESIIEEAAGMPVLVRYHWVPNLTRILKAFPQARKLDEKKQTEHDWNAGKIPILVAHAASCGHGLNLQDGGNIMASFDHWWDLEQAGQIIERIGPLRQRQAGHNRPVFHYPIIARDTADELVIARMETKRSVQDILVEAMKRRRR